MKKLSICCFAAISCLILACGSSYTIRSQKPSSPNLKNYKRIYIGWLDFGEGNWKKYGFSSPRHWSDAIRELNVKSLQEYCRGRLPGRIVSGAKAKGADTPAKSDLYIKLILKKHEIGSGMNRIQYLHMNVRYTDMSSGQVKYDAEVIVDSAGFGLGNYTMEGQLNFAMGNLADFIVSRF